MFSGLAIAARLSKTIINTQPTLLSYDWPILKQEDLETKQENCTSAIDAACLAKLLEEGELLLSVIET